MKFQDLPVQKKLTRLVLYISITILVVTGVIFFAYDYISYKNSTVEKLRTVGQIIATNSTAALAFQSQDDAFDVIRAVSAENEIVSVCLYDEQGQLFSYYPKDAESKMMLEEPASYSFEFKNSYLEMYLPVNEGDRQMGSLLMRYSLSGLTGRIRMYSLISSIAVLISLLIIWLVSKRLRKIITTPILSLADTAQTISNKKDFSLRATKFSKDEVGKLTDAFNTMVQQIEQQNEVLNNYNTDLIEKAEQLEMASKYKSEFLANMSHELRSPLNSLLILADDLAKNQRGNLNAEELESAHIIFDSGRDLLNLINDILDLSKIEAGKMEAHIERVELTDVMSVNSKLFKPVADKKQLRLNTEIDASAPRVIKTDEQKLNQILKNLFSNAIKFTSKGAITLKIEGDGDWVYFHLMDTGIGIPQEKRELIFEAFKQAEGGTSRRYGGTGLGLSIASQLADLLGGRLQVSSEINKGSTFTLVLPRSGEGVPQSVKVKTSIPTITVPAEPVVHQESFENYPTIKDDRDNLTSDDTYILIIEDDEVFAGILKQVAKSRGLKSLVVATGEDGLKLANEYEPAAIVLDLKLPGISGLTVLGELKSNQKYRHIPVHVISALDKSETPIKSGVLNYLTKPVKREQLELTFDLMLDFISKEVRTLLVVEDEKNVRHAIVKIVSLENIQVLEADSVKSAIDILGTHSVDCIILDLGLSDGEGSEIVAFLKNQVEIYLPPIIVYTGKDLSSDEVKKIKKWAENIIIKDVGAPEKLLNEATLLLHQKLEDLPNKKQEIIGQFGDDEIHIQGKKILLVDDDMRNIFALSKFLRAHDLEVFKAEGGQAALDFLAENPNMDMVLMDIMMPDMDGYEATQKIRSQAHFKNLPIIALTAKAMPDDRKKCLDAGASDYFAKPVDTEKLLNLLKLWMK